MPVGMQASPNTSGGIDPLAGTYGSALARQRALVTDTAKTGIIPSQVGEQKGVANLEQLASLFGLSPNVTPSSTLATATGVSMAPPPTAAPAIPGGAVSAGGAWTPSMPGGGTYGTPATVPAVQMPVDTTAATFARAKDRAGQALQGTLKGIQNNAGARGLSGSTAEQAATNSAILGAGQTLADESTQLASDYAREQEQAAETGYQGGVTQRGQDISSLDTTRGQNIGATETANALAEREWEADNANRLAQAQLALTQQGAKYSQLSALGSLLARITPSAVPATGMSY